MEGGIEGSKSGSFCRMTETGAPGKQCDCIKETHIPSYGITDSQCWGQATTAAQERGTAAAQEWGTAAAQERGTAAAQVQRVGRATDWGSES